MWRSLLLFLQIINEKKLLSVLVQHSRQWRSETRWFLISTRLPLLSSVCITTIGWIINDPMSHDIQMLTQEHLNGILGVSKKTKYTDHTHSVKWIYLSLTWHNPLFFSNERRTCVCIHTYTHTPLFLHAVYKYND